MTCRKYPSNQRHSRHFGGSDLRFGQIKIKKIYIYTSHKVPLLCVEKDKPLHCRCSRCVHEQNEMAWMMLKPLRWSKNGGLPSVIISDKNGYRSIPLLYIKYQRRWKERVGLIAAPSSVIFLLME